LAHLIEEYTHMRKVFTASVFALSGLMVVPANAMPFPSLNDGLSGVTPVAFGCGPGRTRGPYGGCHPIGGYGVGAPRVYGAYGAYGYHPYAHAYGYHPYAHRYGYHPYYRRY
jgi:hypothetical protein